MCGSLFFCVDTVALEIVIINIMVNKLNKKYFTKLNIRYIMKKS